MAETTGISWCDSTFNPFIGCTKVSPGCDHCYAEALMDKRWHKVQWGAGQPRQRTSAANWKQPLKWEREAAAFMAEHGRRRRVFCASLADVFDNEVPSEWRADLFALIRATPNLDWLVLTKRVGNVVPMLRLALSSVDKALSTGYDKAHEASTARAGGVRGDSFGRDVDRRNGAGLALEEEDVRPLDRRGEDDTVRARAGRDSIGGRVLASPPDAQRETCGGGGASAGLAPLPRPDPGRSDDQPQERQQGQQPAGQSGTGDLQRAAVARCPEAGRAPPRRARVEAPEDQPARIGCGRDEAAAKERGHGEDDRAPVRGFAERGLSDLSPRDLDALARLRGWIECWLAGEPPANVWLGASVVNQEEADRDIPKLLAAPARVRFLSIEPMLGSVDLSRWLDRCDHGSRPGPGGVGGVSCAECGGSGNGCTRLHWVICGGESGLQARPFDVQWARSIVSQCRDSGVKVFIKQLGAQPRGWCASRVHCSPPEDAEDLRDHYCDNYEASEQRDPCPGRCMMFADRSGGDLAEWPEDLRVQEFP